MRIGLGRWGGFGGGGMWEKCWGGGFWYSKWVLIYLDFVIEDIVYKLSQIK